MKISIVLVCLFSSLFFLPIGYAEQINDSTFSSFTHDAWPKELWHEDLQCYLHSWPTNEALRLQKDGALLKVISTCLFRQKQTRSLTKYTDGLEKLLKTVHEFYPDWILRVYYDASLFVPDNTEAEGCKSLFEKLKTDKHVQLVQYHFPTFLEKNDIYCHQSLFGMITRFLAIFDPSVEVAFMRDADISPISQYDNINKIEQWLTTSNKDFLFYIQKIWTSPWQRHYKWVPAGKFCPLGGAWAARHQDIVIWKEMMQFLIDSANNPEAFLRKICQLGTFCGYGFDEALLACCIVLKKEQDIAVYDMDKKEVRNWLQPHIVNAFIKQNGDAT